MRQISLFGATGTIGDNTLDLIDRHPDKFSLFAASADGNVDKLAEITRRFRRPSLLVIGDEAGRVALHDALPDFDGDILVGADGLAQMARAKTDLAIMAIVGFAGLAPSLICAAQGSGRSPSPIRKRWLPVAPFNAVGRTKRHTDFAGR